MTSSDALPTPHWVLPPHCALALRITGKGRGVFTRSGHPAGEVLLEHWGPRARFSEAVHRGADHILEIGEDEVFLATGGIDDFVNHSCDPNCRLEFRDGRVFLVALRAIPAGHELSFDYATSTTLEGLSAFPGWRFRCLCGAQDCRGEVSCAEEIPPERLRYYWEIGALAPHVRRRVASLLDVLAVEIA